MKKIIKNIFILPFISLAVFFSFSFCSRNSFAPASSATAISMDSNWVFTASFVSPQVGRPGPVNGYYTVTYRDHKLIVYLPYFGEAYGGADLFAGKNPLDFTSTDFSTDTQPVKKGGTEIILKPNDHSEASSMDFIFYSDGRANLHIIMNTRSGISFTGNVKGVQ